MTSVPLINENGSFFVIMLICGAYEQCSCAIGNESQNTGAPALILDCWVCIAPALRFRLHISEQIA